MRKTLRISIWIIGAVVGLYGVLGDYEPALLISAFLIAVGVLLPAFTGIRKK